jgi:signal peptidase I
MSERKTVKKTWYRDWSESIVWAVVMALIIRALVIQAFKIPSGSMEDTLLVGDFLMVNKFIYGVKIPFVNKTILPGLRQPRAGDIIVFKYPIDKRDFIKRCVAVAGDTVEVRDKNLYVNGKRPEEPYVVHKAWGETSYMPEMTLSDIWRNGYQRDWEQRKFLNLPLVRDNFGPVVVPKDCIFAMGDNRDNSLDSRFWGPLPKDLILGKAVFIYWSWDSENGEPLWKVWQNLRFLRLGRMIR